MKKPKKPLKVTNESATELLRKMPKNKKRVGRPPNPDLDYPAADFGHWLRSARAAAGMTQAAVAEKLVMSVSAFSDLERGRWYPQMDTLRRIDKVFPVFDASLRKALK